MSKFDHNPDENPNWTPLVKTRRYACVACGAEKSISTNHTGIVPFERCIGHCREVTNPHTEQERVYPAHTPYKCVEVD